MKRRVVVTGIGLVTPVGNNRETSWSNILAGESGADYVKVFNASAFPTTFGCEVRHFQMNDDAIFAEQRIFLNRPNMFGMASAFEAMSDSGIAGTVQPERFGVSVGSGIGALSPHELAAICAGLTITPTLTGVASQVEGKSDIHIVMKNHPGVLAALLSARWNALGPVTTIHTACASSGQSVGQAFLQIQRGEADAVIAGGADSLSGELLFSGFCLLGALSRRNHDPKGASRPFDKERDGFVASEGAAMLVLEEYDRAKNRGAHIYAEIAGYGETASAYRITDLPPDGRGVVEAMILAIESAGLQRSSIDYINAHGTSTELNDRVEALSIRKVFEGCGKMPLVSSTKSEVGHLISAAGALESALCALAVRDGKVPPTRNLNHTDCGDDIDFVPQVMRERPVYAALSNSVGFGGSNSTVLIKRHDA